mmetsp:Transcript_10538/g.15836  ORF Transcript_10538/g.15836 Transcript_10538/m.15836 type:complete len:317 (+) Transcript_10538:71-1021(+)
MRKSTAKLLAQHAPAEGILDEHQIEGGEIDLSNIQRRVWLIKVPKELEAIIKKQQQVAQEEAKQQNAMNDDDNSDSDDDDQTQSSSLIAKRGATRDIGGVVINSNGTARLDLNGDCNALIKNWQFEFKKAEQCRGTMYALSQDYTDNSGEFRVDGHIAQQGTLRPIATAESYERVMRARTKRIAERKAKQRAVKPYGDLRAPMAGVAAHRTEQLAWGKGEGQKRKARTISKVERMTKNELVNAMFRLFAEKPRYSISEMRKKTGQPIADVKKVLEELCVYHKRGPYKATWELKREYSTGSSSTSTKNISLDHTVPN